MSTFADNAVLKAEFGFINEPSVVVMARQAHEVDLLSAFIETVRANAGVHIAEIAKVVATENDKAFDFEFSNELYWLRHYACSRYIGDVAPCTVTIHPSGE